MRSEVKQSRMDNQSILKQATATVSEAIEADNAKEYSLAVRWLI